MEIEINYYMTIQKLHKILSEQIAMGHGRKPVRVDKLSFSDPSDAEVWMIIDLVAVDLLAVTNRDEEGNAKFRADGAQSTRICCVLSGVELPF